MMNQLRQGASLPHSKQLSNLVVAKIQVRQLPPLDYAEPMGYLGFSFHQLDNSPLPKLELRQYIFQQGLMSKALLSHD